MGKPPICPYCGKKSKLVLGKKIYPHLPNLYHLKIYECEDCDARVGCHDGTTNPKGTLANAELRKKREQTHKVFDKLWKDKHMTRNQAYKWISSLLGKVIHIGESDLKTCDRVIGASTNTLKILESING